MLMNRTHPCVMLGKNPYHKYRTAKNKFIAISISMTLLNLHNSNRTIQSIQMNLNAIMMCKLTCTLSIQPIIWAINKNI